MPEKINLTDWIWVKIDKNSNTHTHTHTHMCRVKREKAQEYHPESLSLWLENFSFFLNVYGLGFFYRGSNLFVVTLPQCTAKFEWVHILAFTVCENRGITVYIWSHESYSKVCIAQWGSHILGYTRKKNSSVIVDNKSRKFCTYS